MTYARYAGLYSSLFVCFLVALVADLFFIDYTHPFIIIGLGAIFIAWSFIVIGATIVGMRRAWNTRGSGFAIIAFSGAVILASVLYCWYPLVYLKYIPVSAALGPACSGEAFPDNPAFQGTGYNTLLGVDSSNTTGKWALYPIQAGWTPLAANEVTLVGCFEEYDSRVETCRYTGATVERYQNHVAVTLVEARTGTVIGQQVFHGTPPGKCVSVVNGSGEIRGAKVLWDDMHRWIEEFVHPAAA